METRREFVKTFIALVTGSFLVSDCDVATTQEVEHITELETDILQSGFVNFTYDGVEFRWTR